MRVGMARGHRAGLDVRVHKVVRWVLRAHLSKGMHDGPRSQQRGLVLARSVFVSRRGSARQRQHHCYGEPGD